MIELYEIGCSNKNNEELLNLLRKNKFSAEAMKNQIIHQWKMVILKHLTLELFSH